MSKLTFDAEKHEYRWDGVVVPSVTTALRHLIDSTWFTEFGRTRGTFVHHATELLDRGELDCSTIDYRIHPYLEAWREFREVSGFKPVLIEQRWHSPSYSYAGTLDRIGILNGRLVILDIKSGELTCTVGPQLAAYAQLAKENKWPCSRRFALQLSRGNYKLTRFSNDRADWQVFSEALAQYRSKEDAERRADAKDGDDICGAGDRADDKVAS